MADVREIIHCSGKARAGTQGEFVYVKKLRRENNLMTNTLSHVTILLKLC
jgi:hypothetical protein